MPTVFEQLARFTSNEPRLDSVVNGGDTTDIQLSDGTKLPSLKKLFKTIMYAPPSGWLAAFLNSGLSFNNKGDRGPNGYSAKTKEQLQAAEPSDGPLMHDLSVWDFYFGDYSGRTDVIFSSLTNYPPTAGAWVRQSADKVATKDGGFVQDAIAIAKSIKELEALDEPFPIGITVRTADGFVYETVNDEDQPFVESSAGTKFRLLQLPSGGYSALAFGIKPGDPAFAAQNVERWNLLCSLGVPIVFPTGRFYINGSVVGGIAGWRGQGQGALYDPTNNSQGTFICCLGDNNGEPFLSPPDDFSGFAVIGDNKQGFGVALGKNGFFRAFKRWRNITVRYFADGMKTYNFYSTSFRNVVIQNNVRGMDMSPSASGGDDGYWTSTDWTNVHIADNEQFGLRTDPPQGSRTWTVNNLVIERNGGVTTPQWISGNISVTGDGVYIEGSPQVPGLKINGTAAIRGRDWLFNGTGGIDTNNNQTTLDIHTLNMTTATDKISNLSSLSRISLSFSNIYTDLTSSPALCELVETGIASINKIIRRRVRSISAGMSIGDDPEFAPRSISFTYFVQKNFTGTIPAHGYVTVIDPRYFEGISADAIAIGKVPTDNPWIDVKFITVGDTLSYYSMVIRNLSDNPVQINNKKVTGFIMRTNDAFELA